MYIRIMAIEKKKQQKYLTTFAWYGNHTHTHTHKEDRAYVCVYKSGIAYTRFSNELARWEIMICECFCCRAAHTLVYKREYISDARLDKRGE